jgi:hypothetical protein
MSRVEINRISGRVAVVLSLIALLTVISGYFQPPQSDEGAAAHIFQIAIIILVPAVLIFLGTADWKRPRRSARPLAASAAVLTLAFGALYYLEHYR